MTPRPVDGSARVHAVVHSTFESLREPERVLALLHELGEHRAELEMQSAELARARAELAALQSDYFELYDLAPVGHLTIDRAGGISRANLAASALLGMDRCELVGSSVGALLVPRDAAQVALAITAVFEHDRRETLEVRFASRSGRHPAGRLHFARLGERALVTLLEQRTREQDGRRRKRRESGLEAALDSVSIGMATLGAGGRLRFCNAALARLLGRPLSSLVGASISQFIPNFPRSPTARVELFVRSNQRSVPVEVTVTASPESEAELVVVVTDVSERKLEQQERNDALLLFNQITESIEDAFYVARASSGESLYASPAFSEIYARPLIAHTREPWPRLSWIHPEDRARVREGVERLWHGDAFDLQYRILHPDGEVRFVHDRAFMLGDRQRVSGVIRDVTRQRTMEEELRHAQRLEAMGTLASGVAHDFNNLLMGVGGCVQLALRRLTGDHPAHAYLTRASEGILRGASLTRQILRIGESRQLPDGSVVLDDVVREIQPLVQTLIGDGITLAIHAGAAGQHVAADATDVEQILMNLVTNARDAMSKVGRLVISTTVSDEQLTLSVEDTGEGMTAAVRARVFEPFFTTKPLGKGTGLGLSTVFALARRLGGRLDVESEPGRGTRVSISLPVIDPVSERRKAPTLPPKRGHETVLVVDDDPLVRLTVENHLEALGYRVLVAASADEAIEICQDRTVLIDVMLTDVMMPGMLGPDLTCALRARNHRFPVLFMSAQPLEELVRQGHVEQSTQVLSKPFDAAALSEALSTRLEQAHRFTESIRQRILVVDDNRDIGEALQETLQLDGNDVELATSADVALKKASSFVPHVVLCDVNLGDDMDGFELTERLRQDPRLSGTHFVALTGFSPSECRERAERAGIRQVLMKPVPTAKLTALVRSLASSRP